MAKKTSSDSGDSAIDAIRSISNKFGKGIILLDDDDYNGTESISTDVAGLDYALNIGGIPVGKVTEIHGPNQGGKTLLCTHIMKNAQKRGAVVYMDLENAFNMEYAQLSGLDTTRNPDKFIFSQPEYGEQAFELAEQLATDDRLNISLICMDSVDMIIPKKEFEGDFEDRHIGGRARLLAQGMHRLTPILKRKNITLLLTNQIRANVSGYGAPTITSGGFALPHYTSVRIETKRISVISDTKGIHGSKHQAKIIKSRVSGSYFKVDYEVWYDCGVSRESSLVTLAAELDVVEKRAAYYYYKDTRIGQGINDARQYLIDNPSLYEEIRSQVFQTKNTLPRVIDEETGEIIETGEIFETDGDDNESE